MDIEDSCLVTSGGKRLALSDQEKVALRTTRNVASIRRPKRHVAELFLAASTRQTERWQRQREVAAAKKANPQRISRRTRIDYPSCQCELPNPLAQAYFDLIRATSQNLYTARINRAKDHFRN